MSTTPNNAVLQTPLEAASPFELRINLGKDVPESDVRTALASGDMGFLHSFTTGSAVDGPWALFRTLDDGQLEAGDAPEKFFITFQVGARKTRYRMRRARCAMRKSPRAAASAGPAHAGRPACTSALL